MRSGMSSIWLNVHFSLRMSEVAKTGGNKGLGLGLFLARGIAAAHGGTLTVDSTPGTGARFHLTLPLATDHT